MLRKHFINQIEQNFKIHRITAILGPRQCGKTTLARQYGQGISEENYFDLENPKDLARLTNPNLALEGLKGLIVIDEIQRRPDLFPVLRYLHDYFPEQKYLILGSASRDLIHQSSESLAGRIGYVELTPFNFLEVTDLTKLWYRGGFPQSYFPESAEQSQKWRFDYIQTFLEQDIPTLGFSIPANQLRRFWKMVAHYHGNILNSSEIGRSLDSSHVTIKKYADLLVGTFMIRLLQPWYENLKKRQTKSAKVYIRDSGLLHALLDLENPTLHPVAGASWEGFAIEQILAFLTPREAYFWNAPAHAELDLLILRKGMKIGFEIKYTDHPKITASMQICLQDLDLEHLYVITPGDQRFFIQEKIEVLGIKRLAEGLAHLKPSQI